MEAPRPENSRHMAFDALCGLAVLGLVCTSALAYALPQQAYYNPAIWGDNQTVDRAAWLAGFVFVEDKFRFLFAMLFGAACLALWEKADRSWRGHYVGMAVLLVLGLLHAVLLTQADILRGLALAGLAVPILAPLNHRALYAITIGLIAVYVGAGIVMFGSSVLDYYAAREGTDAALFVERSFGRDAPAMNHALELGCEQFGESVARRLADIPSQLWVTMGSVPGNLAAIALGMALWKNRMLAREWRLFRMQRLAAISAAIALPVLFGLASWVSEEGFPAALVGAVSLVLSTPFDLLLALAYAALAMAFFGGRGWLVRALAAVGKLPITNYLASSLVLAAIFASWGLGWFAQTGRAEAFAISALPIAALLIWSPVWVRYFRTGPVELLLRAMVRLLT